MSAGAAARPGADIGSRRGYLVLVEVAAVALITAVAASLRFYQLDVAPPGLYHDEAIYGILGLYVYHGNRSLFFGEREGLFMYILAWGMRLLGQDAIALRIIAASVGTAAIPLFYLLVRVLLGRRAALLATAGLAGSYWHVTLSRDVFRALTLPTFETLAMLCLWVALRQRRRWTRPPLFILAGAALGLVLYTYIAGRIVPVVVLTFLLIQLIWDRRQLAPAWLNLPAYFATAALVFAPLFSFFMASPSAFFGRMEEVSLGNTADIHGLSAYLENGLRVAGMFFVAGDQNLRHNLSGRPVFDPVLAVFFVLGVLICLRGWRRAENRFLLLWAPAMLLPTAAASEAPHFLRAIGAIPPIYALLGVGLEGALRWTQPRLRPLAGRWGFARFAGLVLFVPAAITATTYFGTWLNLPQTYLAYDGPLASAGRFLAASPAWRESAAGLRNFYLTTHFWQDRATMLYYLWPYVSGRDRDDLGNTRLGSRWLDENEALVLRPDGASYLVADESCWAANELRWLYGVARVQVTRPVVPPSAGGSPFVALSVPATPLPSAATPQADFGGALLLQDSQLPPTATAGETFDVVTTWRFGDVPDAWRKGGDKMVVFVHLLDADGSLLADAEGLGYKPADWADDETLLLRHSLRVPAGTAPGKYKLVVGLLGPDGQRVPESVARGEDGTFLLTDSLTVVRPANAPQPPALDSAADFTAGGEVALLGLRYPGGAQTMPGGTLKVELYWQALADVAADYEMSLALVGPDGAEPGRTAGRPAFGRYPTNGWRANELVRDPRSLAVGARARGGTYSLVLTATNVQTGVRVGPTPIGTVQVTDLARSFTPPPMGQSLPTPANFGDLAELLGYDLDTTSAKAGGSLRLTLYWRCRSETDKRYKVFTHLLSPAGTVAAQVDAEPVGNTRPLTSWVGGEVITDAYDIPLPAPLPAGNYQLEVGLYAAPDGARLPLLDAAGKQADTRLLLPPLALPK